MKRGANCPAPDYGKTVLESEEVAALAVANLIALGKREMGVRGFMEDVRAVDDAGYVAKPEQSMDEPLEDRIADAARRLPELKGLEDIARMLARQQGLVD